MFSISIPFPPPRDRRKQKGRRQKAASSEPPQRRQAAGAAPPPPRPKPAWDATRSDLDRYRLNEAEQVGGGTQKKAFGIEDANPFSLSAPACRRSPRPSAASCGRAATACAPPAKPASQRSCTIMWVLRRRSGRRPAWRAGQQRSWLVRRRAAARMRVQSRTPVRPRWAASEHLWRSCSARTGWPARRSSSQTQRPLRAPRRPCGRRMWQQRRRRRRCRRRPSWVLLLWRRAAAMQQPCRAATPAAMQSTRRGQTARGRGTWAPRHCAAHNACTPLPRTLLPLRRRPAAPPASRSCRGQTLRSRHWLPGWRRRRRSWGAAPGWRRSCSRRGTRWRSCRRSRRRCRQVGGLAGHQPTVAVQGR